MTNKKFSSIFLGLDHEAVAVAVNIVHAHVLVPDLAVVPVHDHVVHVPVIHVHHAMDTAVPGRLSIHQGDQIVAVKVNHQKDQIPDLRLVHDQDLDTRIKMVVIKLTVIILTTIRHNTKHTTNKQKLHGSIMFWCPTYTANVYHMHLLQNIIKVIYYYISS